MTRSHKIGWIVLVIAVLFMLWRLPRLHGQGFGSFSHDQPYLAKDIPFTDSLTNGLQSYWKLEEAAAATREDSVGNNDLTPVANPLQVSGKVNNAAQFAAASSMGLQSTAEVGLGLTNDFTITGWFWPSNLTGQPVIASKADAAVFEWFVYIYNQKLVFTFYKADNSEGGYADSIGPLTAAAWNFFAVTWDSTNRIASIYVNNVIRSMSSLTNNAPATKACKFYLGKFGGGLPFDGMIDEVGVWNRVLEFSEILRLYNNGTGNTHPDFNGVQPSVPLTVLTNNSFAFNDTATTFDGSGETFYRAGPSYPQLWLPDTWFAAHGRVDKYPSNSLYAIVSKTYAAKDVNGNIPIAITNTGAGYLWRSGCLTNSDYVEMDGLWSLIYLHRIFYDLYGNTSLFANQSAVLAQEMLEIPRSNNCVYITKNPNGWIPFGFNDGIDKTGHDLMGTLLYYKAARDMALLYTAVGDAANAATFNSDADNIVVQLNDVTFPLWNTNIGMFEATTEQNKQTDIFGSAFADYVGVASAAQSAKISDYLSTNFVFLVDTNGFVRMSPALWAYSSGGDQCDRGTGSYDDANWSHGIEWIMYSMSKRHLSQARKLCELFAFGPNATNSYEYIMATNNPTYQFGGLKMIVGASGAFRWASTNRMR